MNKLIVVLVAVVLTAGCKKYEEGPDFSLRSKKSRLTGTWEITSRSGPVNPSISFWKFTSKKFISSSNKSESNSEVLWDFEEHKSQIKIYTGQPNDMPIYWNILKLSNNELKVANSLGRHNGVVSLKKID